MKKKLLSALLILNSSFLLFCQRVISPVAGNFNNKQALVIDTSDGAECFYSLSGSDPLTSGFAYDGPVLIDSIGRSNVRVVAVKGNKREDIEINYNVQQVNPFEAGSSEADFIGKTVFAGVYPYSAENTVKIPSTLKYCIGDGEKPFAAGKELKISAESSLCRYVPCNVTDGKNKWRFLIFVSGSESGTFARQEVPFTVSDWNVLVFTGEKLIWCVDDGEWSASKIPVKLDRSVAHTVKWQSVAYEKGNPVSSFVLPAEPVLSVSGGKISPVTFTVDGDLRYRMQLVSAGVSGQAEGNSGFFTSTCFDTFDGDCISGEAEFAFYCEGVLQGTKKAFYKLDRQPPVPPVIVTENKGFYSRGNVKLSVTAEENSKIFIAVSKGVKITEDEAADIPDQDDPQFDSVETGTWQEYKSAVELGSGSDSAVFYKVSAYAVDDDGNTSEVSVYRVIIDSYNYYLDAAADAALADGSRKHPFATLEQAAELINKSQFVHFYVKGNFTVNNDIVLNSDCAFTGRQNASFTFEKNSSVQINGGMCELRSLLISKTEAGIAGESKFFVVNKGSLSLKDCECVCVFSQSGTAFSAEKSVIEFVNSGVTVQGQSYACAVSGHDSKVMIKNGRFSSVAQTAVNFSINGGLFECRSSKCKVVSHLGRIAELTHTNARLTDNEFAGEFDKKVRGITAVWSDRESFILENKSNIEKGF